MTEQKYIQLTQPKSITLPVTVNYVKQCTSGNIVKKHFYSNPPKPFTVKLLLFFLNKILKFVFVVLKSKYGFMQAVG
jgi:hypothetical protein